MSALQKIDIWLFQLINKSGEHWLLTETLPVITNLLKNPWFLYLILPVGLGIWFYKKRKWAFRVFVSLLIVAGVTDLFCYWGLKSVIHRPRPNHIESLNAQVRVPYGPKSPSFPSNHAATTMSLMMVLSWHYPALRFVFWAYAFVAAYSRVYVGVHFPLDVIGGLFIGFYLFYFMRWALFFRFLWFIPKRLQPGTL